MSCLHSAYWGSRIFLVQTSRSFKLTLCACVCACARVSLCVCVCLRVHCYWSWKDNTYERLRWRGIHLVKQAGLARDYFSDTDDKRQRFIEVHMDDFGTDTLWNALKWVTRPNLKVFSNPTTSAFSARTLREVIPGTSKLALVNFPKEGERVPHGSFNTKYKCDLPDSSVKWGSMLNRTFCGEKKPHKENTVSTTATLEKQQMQRAAFCGVK